jgi:cytochrome oxidase Cu insertion factor (SCO1/SenC/PrrC family)
VNKLFNFILALAMVSSFPAWSAAPANGAATAVQASAAMLTWDEKGARQYFTDLELVTQNGQPVRFFTDVLKDRVVLINFIFTHCQDACPLISQKLLETRGLLDEAVSGRVYFISISIDPERDTPEALTEFATKFKLIDDNWVFLTGEVQNVEHIVKKLGQYDENVEEHSTLILAGNVNKRHWVKIPPTTPPVGIAEKLRLLTEDD